MPLTKLQFKPGINKEVTRYTAEGSWYDCDKVRFRFGFPEKIGGWQRISDDTFIGVCRSLFGWSSLDGIRHRGVGTHLKFYAEVGGAYFDITPIRETTAAGDVTFAAVDGSETITVSDTLHGANVGDFVTFSGAATLGGNITDLVLNQEYQIQSVADPNTYTITARPGGTDVDNPATVTANISDSGNGGASTVGTYQINVGSEFSAAPSGWGNGSWGSGGWGLSTDPSSLIPARLWSQGNFGEDLVFGPRGGGLYLWDLSAGTATRGALVTGSEIPVQQELIYVSDINRFVFCLGTNDVGTSTVDPMLVRWSDQEDVTNWNPAATNQAGSIRLSRGNRIVAVDQSRQEVLVWTDSSLYSLQFVGAPIVWGAQLIGDNLSIASQNATVYANGMIFWMGETQFYMYDGRVQDLTCSLLRYVFSDINKSELSQVFGGANEEFQEVWWFYPSQNSGRPDRYVIYNYAQNIWYHGNLERSAWEDAFGNFAATYSSNIVEHEIGNDDAETSSTVPITAQITSAPTDMDDGTNFSFMWRVLPDVTFTDSESPDPQVTMTFFGLKKTGSDYQVPTSEGGVGNGTVIKAASGVVENYTEQLNIRVRARQLVMQVTSDTAGVAWQLGSPLIDMRTDGRQG